MMSEEQEAQIREAVGELEFAGVPFEILKPLYDWMEREGVHLLTESDQSV